MKIVRYVFLLIFLANLLPAGAQVVKVYGVVKDSLTGTPLEGASVVLDFRKTNVGAKSDKNGHFVVGVYGKGHILNIRYLGYVPYSYTVPMGNDSIFLEVLLPKVSNLLEQVVVTSKGFDKTVRKPILGANQINIKTLQKIPAVFGEVDLLRGIQMLPGVSSVGEASNGVNIRGGTTDQNLILLDDTPIFNPTHMFGLFSVVPPDAVSNLDLYKGNVPGRFGGRAASVMDISLKNPNLEKFRMNGGISLVSNRLMMDVPLVKEKLGIYVAGRGAFNDFLLPIASERLVGIKTKFAEFVSKGFWRINQKNTFTAMGYHSYDYFRTGLLTNLPNVVGTSTFFKHQTTNLMGRWLHVINSKMDIQTTVMTAHYNPTIATVEAETNNNVELKSNLVQNQVKSNLNYQLKDHKLESGIILTQYLIRPGTLEPNNSLSVNYITTPSERANELAWYADDEINISKTVALSLGLRYSYFMSLGPSDVRVYEPGQPRDDFSVMDTLHYKKGAVTGTYGGLEPRIGFRYAFTPDISVKFGYNLMRQYIQVVSNTTTPIPTSRWKTSDRHIKPQISNLVTAGYYQSIKDNIYEFSLEGYYRFTQNMMDYKPGADFLLQQYPETQLIQGISKAYGVEFMASKKKGTLTGWANYTYSRTLNRVNGDLPAIELVNGGDWYSANYDKPHTVNASIDVSVDKHNSFGFNFVYSTGRPYTQPVGFVNYQNNVYPFYDKRNNARIPDYHRLDFSWNIFNPRMKDKRWKGNWAFTVYNAYARKNVYSVFFKSEQESTKAYNLKIFASAIVTIAYNFTFE